MSNGSTDSESEDGSREHLSGSGLLNEGEKIVAALRLDSVGDDRRGAALSLSRLFSYVGTRINRAVAFKDVQSAECKVRLRRTARYEFLMSDGSTTSILLNGEPGALDAFCGRLDEICASRYPDFEPKAAPEEEMEPPQPQEAIALPESPPVQKPLPKPEPPHRAPPSISPYEYRTAPSYTSPGRHAIAAFLLGVGALVPVYGLVFAMAAAALVFLNRSSGRFRDPDWDPALERGALVLAVLGLVTYIMFRLALRYPDVLARLHYGESDFSRNVGAGIAVGVVSLVVGVSFHEAAHALVSYWNGDTTAAKMGRITLNPLPHIDPFGSVILPLLLLFSSGGSAFFAYARPVPVNPTRYRNLRLGYVSVSFAGPGSNFLLALAALWAQFFLACLLGAIEGMMAPGSILGPNVAHVANAAYFVLKRFYLVNVFLGCFNLLPIPPLDGYHILEGLLPFSWTEAIRPVERFGFLILFVLLMSGALVGVFVVVSLLADLVSFVLLEGPLRL